MNDGEFKDKYRIIFVLGFLLYLLRPPGSGKNTQCDRIIDRYSLIHFSAGDLLREEVNRLLNSKVKNKTENGNFINNIIKEGKIVPVKITCKLIENAMSNYDKEKNIFIIDGFPRNEENYLGWCENMKESAQIVCILFLECPESVCTERILKRSENSGRVDDNKSSLIKRFNTFSNETCPLIESLENNGEIKIVKVNANQIAEKVFTDIAERLDKIIPIL